MLFPLPMTSRIAGYVARKRLTRTKKFPMVLMLEPLHACNLTCTGCGRIREHESSIKHGKDATGPGCVRARMRGHEDCRALLIQRAQHVQDFFAMMGVEVTGRFVGQNESRITDHSSGY